MCRPQSRLFKAITNMLSLLTQGFKADTDAVLLAYMLPVAKLSAGSGQAVITSVTTAAARLVDIELQ